MGHPFSSDVPHGQRLASLPHAGAVGADGWRWKATSSARTAQSIFRSTRRRWSTTSTTAAAHTMGRLKRRRIKAKLPELDVNEHARSRTARACRAIWVARADVWQRLAGSMDATLVCRLRETSARQRTHGRSSAAILPCVRLSEHSLPADLCIGAAALQLAACR